MINVITIYYPVPGYLQEQFSTTDVQYHSTTDDDVQRSSLSVAKKIPKILHFCLFSKGFEVSCNNNI